MVVTPSRDSCQNPTSVTIATRVIMKTLSKPIPVTASGVQRVKPKIARGTRPPKKLQGDRDLPPPVIYVRDPSTEMTAWPITYRSGSTNKSSLCHTLKKRTLCCKDYETGKKAAKHKCGWAVCPYCTLDVKIDSHQCYIQPESPTCDDPRVNTVPLNRVGTRAIVNINARQGTAQVERDPPLLVYADYEAVTGEGLQTPIMVCAESEEEEETHTFYGSGCTKDFFDYLDELCVDCDGDDREVIVFFHNF